ncbi:inorganic diphosphatase [Mucilaginibacter ginkgonis]|uniref:inorganic diphosphatase n=1 Tax=Mucilaginibacter ginkgonis TaxID=2682091 RepID=A0A7T7JG60_9SPHI|nr:inorganic diphosphatase [Mucilaginibacter ginkgonis]QQL49152.1 inorganic diphosphatase [Mucilaginibacter ginkgonis]
MNKTVNVMIECPKGSNFKLDFEPESHTFRLSKVLPAGLVFPFDFGMIPNTKGQDGDPLDVIVVSELATFPGCIIEVRVIGALQAIQTERDGKTMRNDRFIGIPMVSQLFSEILDINQLSENILNQVEHFFKNYNDQAGKNFEVIARLGAEEANKLVYQ